MEEHYYTPKQNWFQRNLKWVIPAGCVSLLTIVILFAVGIYFGVTSLIKNSDVYIHTMETVKKSSKVQSLLGNPLQENGTVLGEIKSNGNSGTADFKIPIKGSIKSGYIHVKAIKSNHVWTYSKMYFYTKDTNVVIDLLNPK